VSLFSLTTSIENNDLFHMSRLLMLIDVFATSSGDGSIEGLTKLAKLDFLLRYPVNLERALAARGANPVEAGVLDFERSSVEAHMVRFKYGPWDFRYRRFINLLVAKGLVHVYIKGRTVHLGITPRGRESARNLAGEEIFSALHERSILLKRHLDLGATSLMQFIYKTFPELTNMAYGETINELQAK
jgi:hypothetical protein